jgi:archaellum component FlaG (FlaF/FlaG flagellin family)
MDEMFQESPRKRVNPLFIGAAVFGIVVITLAIWLLSFKPSMEEQTARILAGSLREGSPEFEQLTKDIVISTDPNTIESPMALGGISMFISGTIRNKGTRTLDALEINVSVVTQFNQVLKEKRMLVVPTQVSRLEPGQTIPVTVSLEGFSKNDDRANIRWKVTAIRVEQ